MDDPGHNQLFDSLTRKLIENRWVAIAAFIVITFAMLTAAKNKLKVDITNDSFIASDDPSRIAQDEYREDFGREDRFLIVAQGDVFTADYLTKLRALHDDLANIKVELTETKKAEKKPAAAPAKKDDFGFEGDVTNTGNEGSIVEEETSLLNARHVTTASDGALVVGNWFDPMPPATELPNIGKKIVAEQGVASRLIASDQKSSVIVLRTIVMAEKDSNKTYQALLGICEKHTSPGFKCGVGGYPALVANVIKMTQEDSARLLGMGFLVMLILLGVIFRHPVGVLAPVIVTAISAMWTIGAMALFGLPITIVTNILPLVVMSSSVSDSIHVLSTYRDFRLEGRDNDDAVCAANADAGVPCFLTAATTAAGLISFKFSSIHSVRQLGASGALGIGIGFIVSITLLPVLLSFNKKSLLGRRPDRKHDRFDAVIEACNGLARTRRPLVYATTAVIIVTCAFFAATRLRTEHDPVEWLPSSNAGKQATMFINDHITGIASANLLVTAKGPNGVKDLKLLQQLERVEKRVLEHSTPAEGKLATHARSLLDVARDTNRAVHDSDQAYFKLPDQQGDLLDELFLFEASDKEELHRFVTTDFKTTHLSFNVKWVGPPRTDAFIANMNKAIAEEVDPKLAEVHPTGDIYTYNHVISKLMIDMAKQFGAAFLLTTLLMIFLFRSIKVGLIAMVPNVIPVILVPGGMALAGFPLDLVSVLAGSIIIGLVVDDTVHYFHHFHAHFKESGDVDKAIHFTMTRSGRAMVQTTVVMSLFFLMHGAAQLTALFRFGVTISATLLVGSVFDLIVSPSLLYTFHGGKKDKAAAVEKKA